MSTAEQDVATAAGAEAAEATPSKPKLDLDVQISDAGPCKKHVKVAIARADIDRQFQESLGEVRKDAQVPGFRPGRAPKSLVERRFRKEVSGQVKSTLLMACLEQLDEDHKLNAISQPEFDVQAVEIPDEGPMRFELDVEVQPDFATPSYKGLTAHRRTKELTEADVDAQQTTFLERYAQMVPKFEGGAEVGDYIIADLTFHKDGITLNTAKEVTFRLQPELRFQDGHVPQLAEALTGVSPGEDREADAQIGASSPDPALRGQTIRVNFNVKDLKQLRLPQVDAAFLSGIGFNNADDLRTALKAVLERRVEYQQRQAIRREVLDQLMGATQFDLPTDLVTRQEKSTLRRQVSEMRQGGLSDSEIRAREAEVRANAHQSTLRSLKEFFILSKIAEAETLKVEDADFEQEIDAIASRTDETPRRVRARIEKEGLAENIAAQILERKTLDRILEFVKYEEVPLQEERAVETLDTNVAAEPVGNPDADTAASEGESAAPDPSL